MFGVCDRNGLCPSEVGEVGIILSILRSRSDETFANSLGGGLIRFGFQAW